MAKVASFDIEYYQYLDPEGHGIENLAEKLTSAERIIELYSWMTRVRVFDSKAIALQRTGKIGTYASSLGQEAIGVAIGCAMQDEDILAPAYREYGAMLPRGVRMRDILLYWGGDERGMDYQGAARHDFPICVPIATQVPHAVGAAYAFKLQNKPQVVVCVCGDGATSKGEFYEGLNAAKVWDLPVVFVVNNNQWAISVPRSLQTHAETIAQKAIAAGMPGEQVDGNDIMAMLDRLSIALDNARCGGGPRLIEALSYRLCDHTTADDASRYRSDEELEKYQAIEPLLRVRKWLEQTGNWDDDKEASLQHVCSEEVENEVKAYLAVSKSKPQSMFTYLYETLPDVYQQQRHMLKENSNES